MRVASPAVLRDSHCLHPAATANFGELLNSETYRTARLQPPDDGFFLGEGEWRSRAAEKLPVNEPDRAFAAFVKSNPL